VVVLVKDSGTGAALFRGWVPTKIIDARRQTSDSFKYAEQKGGWAKDRSTWHVWPVEMSMKAAIHYAVSRGWAVIDDTEAVRALSVDGSADIVDSTAEVVATDRPRGKSALGLAGPRVAPETHRIEAPQDVPDELLDAQEQPEPELAQEPEEAPAATAPARRRSPLPTNGASRALPL